VFRLICFVFRPNFLLPENAKSVPVQTVARRMVDNALIEGSSFELYSNADIRLGKIGTLQTTTTNTK
jgi:hypothetical protein